MAYRDAYKTCMNCEKMDYGSISYGVYKANYELYSLKANAVKKDIMANAKKMLRVYEKDCKKCTAAKRVWDTAAVKVKNYEKQYKKGKISKVKVLAAKVGEAEKKWKYYTVLVERLIDEKMLSEGV